MKATRRGASLLLESVFGFGLLSVVVLLCLGVFPAFSQSASLTRNMAGADFLACQLLEQQRAAGYDRVVNRPDTSYTLQSTINGNQVVQQFTYRVDTQAVNPQCKAVKVTVSWIVGDRTAAGRQRQLQMSTYVGSF